MMPRRLPGRSAALGAGTSVAVVIRSSIIIAAFLLHGTPFRTGTAGGRLSLRRIALSAILPGRITTTASRTKTGPRMQWNPREWKRCATGESFVPGAAFGNPHRTHAAIGAHLPRRRPLSRFSSPLEERLSTSDGRAGLAYFASKVRQSGSPSWYPTAMLCAIHSRFSLYSHELALQVPTPAIAD